MPVTVSPAYITAPVRAPLDGELATAADLVALTVAPIVNQTYYNQERVDGLAATNAIRSVSIEDASFLNTVWGLSSTNPSFRKYIVQNDYTGTGYNVLIEITNALPISGKIKAVGCEVIGATRSPALLPSAQYLPSIGLVRVQRLAHPSLAGDSVPIYEGQDQSVSYEGYTNPHLVRSDPIDPASMLAINLATYRYFIEFRGEYPNANAHNGLILYGAFVEVTTI